MLREQRDHVLLRQRIDDAALAADDPLGAPQRVDDGLLGRVDGRGEERVELLVVEAIAAAGGREGLAISHIGYNVR
jgi:hypothetical protein